MEPLLGCVDMCCSQTTPLLSRQSVNKAAGGGRDTEIEGQKWQEGGGGSCAAAASHTRTTQSLAALLRNSLSVAGHTMRVPPQVTTAYGSHAEDSMIATNLPRSFCFICSMDLYSQS